MLFPLVVLAILSVIGGWVGIPAAMFGHDDIGHFLAPVFSSGATAEVPTSGTGLELRLTALSVLVAVLGFCIAYIFYYRKPGAANALAERSKAVYAMICNKYWIDEIYSAFIVAPLLMFTRGILDLLVDRGIVNGSGRAAAMAVRGFAWATRTQISGNIRSYAGWLAAGAAAVIAAMVFGHSLWVHL